MYIPDTKGREKKKKGNPEEKKTPRLFIKRTGFILCMHTIYFIHEQQTTTTKKKKRKKENGCTYRSYLDVYIVIYIYIWKGRCNSEREEEREGHKRRSGNK
jgi:hypothetical protein